MIMKYNFDEIIDRRHTNALNTDGFRGYIFHDFEGKKIFPFKDEEFVRMWIADMEFAMCPHIIDAIKSAWISASSVTVRFLSSHFTMHIMSGVKRCTAGPIPVKIFAFLWESFRHCLS